MRLLPVVKLRARRAWPHPHPRYFLPRPGPPLSSYIHTTYPLHTTGVNPISASLRLSETSTLAQPKCPGKSVFLVTPWKSGPPWRPSLVGVGCSIIDKMFEDCPKPGRPRPSISSQLVVVVFEKRKVL